MRHLNSLKSVFKTFPDSLIPKQIAEKKGTRTKPN